METANKKGLSIAIILVIYIIASVVGVLFYNLLPLAMWLKLLLADIAATIVVFIFSLLFKNASVYDPYWSVQPLVILALFAFGENLNIVKILLILVIFIWGIRLTANWAYTFSGLHSQDWRYTLLKEKTKKFYPIINFVGIHLVPTLIVYACTLPAVFLIQSNIALNNISIIFIVLALGAVILQGTADYQMHKYQLNKTTTFIRTGLWKYSRHPNYLGEILFWWCVGLTCVTALGGMWYLLTGALLNTILFLSASIPLAEGKQSKKEGYAEYKKQTRMLLPIKK